jgi:hypothetical protein
MVRTTRLLSYDAKRTAQGTKNIRGNIKGCTDRKQGDLLSLIRLLSLKNYEGINRQIHRQYVDFISPLFFSKQEKYEYAKK